MYEELKGKKLLILGAYQTETEIIKACKKLEIYTVVTDSHLDWRLAPAKFEANEAWNISWSDINEMKKKCVEENIDGCFAGFSEKRISYAQQLARELGKPFYTDNASLDLICDKMKFKQACIESGVKVPRNFTYGEKIEYPVIVKPVDNGGSRGITICYTDDELELAYKKALNCSDSKEAVIEQYIQSEEVMIYFTVHNGIIDLSAMCDRYMHRFDKNITQLPVGYYYPSKHLNIFVEYNLENYKVLIKNLGIKDGLIAFQAFIVGNDAIPFDPTYRLDGTMAYHMIEKRNGINVLNMLISKSITGKMGNDDFISEKEDPYFSHPTFELPILLKNGTISKIVGLDEVKYIKNVLYVYQGLNVGDETKEKADFSQIIFRIHMYGEDNEDLKKAVKNIYDVLRIYDENGEDMIIGRNAFMIGG